MAAQALAALREEASALDVEDIVALCFAFNKDPRRLRVYLDVLRGKAGVKAQAAACLVCFDLARQGDVRFEAEFMALIPVMTEWASPDAAGGLSLAERLIGDNEYLRALWVDLRGRLTRLDPREEPGEGVLEADTLEIALLDEDDLDEIGLTELDVLEVDVQALRAQWLAALDRFCFWNPDPATARPDAPPGFFADHRADMARLDRFRQDALSLSHDVREAAEILPLLDLFLAAHTRARTLFGSRNRKRDEHLERGLGSFCALPGPPAVAVAWLMDPTAAPFSWEKVAELLLDYLAFFGHQPRALRTGPIPWAVNGYLRSNRPQPPPTVLGGDARERRRR